MNAILFIEAIDYIIGAHNPDKDKPLTPNQLINILKYYEYLNSSTEEFNNHGPKEPRCTGCGSPTCAGGPFCDLW